MRELVPIENEKADAYSNILRFYSEGDIVLSAAEEGMLNRWCICDTLIRQRKFKSEQIVEQLVARFGISKYTAQLDIKQTYALFGQVRVISKQYIIAHSIENIQIKIAQWENDKSLAPLVPKLYDTLLRATAQLEDELTKKNVPASTVIINVVQGQVAEAMPFDKAKELLQQRKAQTKTYDDFEDVT